MLTNVNATVKNLIAMKVLKTNDGREYKKMTLILGLEENQEVAVNLLNDRAEEWKDVKPGTALVVSLKLEARAWNHVRTGELQYSQEVYVKAIAKA